MKNSIPASHPDTTRNTRAGRPTNPGLRPWASFELAATVTAAVLAVSTVYAGAEGPRVVKNPYSDIEWGEVKAYRANFHSHTVISDGRAEPGELIHLYADAGYHILALSDHDNGYNHREGERDLRETYIHRDDRDRVPTSETTWPWTRWIDEKPTKIWVYGGIESSAFYPDLGEEGMLAVRGAELSSSPHISSLFNRCGWPDHDRTDDDRLSCVEKHGGLAFWAHPTHYVPGGPWEDRFFDEQTWEEAVEFFGHYIAEYDSLLGFEMNVHDVHGGRVDRDRELFDRLLERYYREHDIFIEGSDDNHGTRVAEDATLTLVLASELTEDAVRHALKNGHTFVGPRAESYPRFNGIEVDDDAQTISLDIDNHDKIRWIRDGRDHATGSVLDYSEIEDAMVRFEIDLDGATFYSQGFYIR